MSFLEALKSSLQEFEAAYNMAPQLDPPMKKMLTELYANVYFLCNALSGHEKKGTLISAEDKYEFLSIHQEIAKRIEQYFATNPEEDPNSTLGRLAPFVRTLCNLTVENYMALVRYRPEAKRKPIKQIMEEGRPPMIKLAVPLAQHECVGASVSQRFRIKYKKGDTVTDGFFTLFNKFQSTACLKELLTEIMNHTNDAECRQLFQNLLGNDPTKIQYGNFISSYEYKWASLEQQCPLREEDRSRLMLLILMESCKYNSDCVSADSVALGLSRLLGHKDSAKVISAIGRDNLTNMARMFSREYGILSCCLTFTRFPDGVRIDNRSSVAHDIALVLGVGDVLMDSYPMRVQLTDGNLVEGSYCEFVYGMDPKSKKHTDWEAFKNVSSKSLFANDGKLIHALSIIQILDFIYANVDRHANNLIFPCDKQHNLINTVAIDTDFAFGLISTLLPNVAMSRLLNPWSIPLSPQSLADTIKKTDPVLLKYIMYGNGFSLAEANALESRFTVWKNHLKTGEFCRLSSNQKLNLQKNKVIILPDQDFKWIDPKNFDPMLKRGAAYQMEQETNNIYYHVYHASLSAYKRAAKAEREEKKKAKADKKRAENRNKVEAKKPVADKQKPVVEKEKTFKQMANSLNLKKFEPDFGAANRVEYKGLKQWQTWASLLENRLTQLLQPLQKPKSKQSLLFHQYPTLKSHLDALQSALRQLVQMQNRLLTCKTEPVGGASQKMIGFENLFPYLCNLNKTIMECAVNCNLLLQQTLANTKLMQDLMWGTGMRFSVNHLAELRDGGVRAHLLNQQEKQYLQHCSFEHVLNGYISCVQWIMKMAEKGMEMQLCERNDLEEENKKRFPVSGSQQNEKKPAVTANNGNAKAHGGKRKINDKLGLHRNGKKSVVLASHYDWLFNNDGNTGNRRFNQADCSSVSGLIQNNRTSHRRDPQ